MKTLTKEDVELVNQIVTRTESFSGLVNGYGPKLELLPIYIIGTHINSRELDLDKFLNFNDFNFLHDIVGILDHFDEETTTLSNRFLPRCAK